MTEMNKSWYTPSTVRRMLDHYDDLKSSRVPRCRNKNEHQRCCLSGEKYAEVLHGGNGRSASDNLEAHRIKADIDMSMQPEITPGQSQLRPLTRLERTVVTRYGQEQAQLAEVAREIRRDQIRVLVEYRRAIRKMATNLGWVDEKVGNPHINA